MRAVHISIGHDDNVVITQLVRVELFFANTTAKSSHYGADFCGTQHFIETGFFYVQNLPFQWKDGLKLTITALFCTTAGRITLHQVQLT